MESAMENALEIAVEIVLEDINSTITEVLLFPTSTASLEDVKTRIEECYSIPVCVQKIIFRGTGDFDDDLLQSGNILSVFCPREGDVGEVKSVTEWLKQCVEILKYLLQNSSDPNGKGKATATLPKKSTLPEKSVEILWNKGNLNLIENHLFNCWLNPSTEVNCQHFYSLGGVDLLVKYHKLLLQLRQSGCNVELGKSTLYLEWLCCKAICGFCCNNEMARLVADSGALGGCIGSLLIKVEWDGKSMVNDQSFRTIVMALCAICNIADCPNIPDVLQFLSSNAAVIQYVLQLLGSSSIYSPYIESLSLLICLSRCRDSHCNLLTPDFVRKILVSDQPDACMVDSHSLQSHLTLQSYQGLVISQMVSCSPQLLANFPPPLLGKMLTLLETVSAMDPAIIRQYEESTYIVWGTFAHCVQCLYEPNHTPLTIPVADLEHASMIDSLRSKSQNVLLLHLHSCLGRKDHVEVLIKEDLFDFVTLLPWIVSRHLQKKASLVVQELSKFHQIEPASLATLSMATLAKTRWGLHQALQRTATKDFS